MLDMILQFLSYALMFTLGAMAICGTVVFFLAATWMQVQERSAGHGQGS